MTLPKFQENYIPRKMVAGMENVFTKMWDPPRASPQTPELLSPTNPVPNFMEQTLGVNVFGVTAANTVQRALLDGVELITWDGLKTLMFMSFRDPDMEGGGFWPGATIRVPRGVIFHCATHAQGPPPHTIHWHGLEPTPMNDGVGHCSMELGDYTYQFQPNFIGTYFYHCHRNTVQHFEFGLYGMFLVEPPDAFEGPNAGGYPRRTAANLEGFGRYADKYVGGDTVFGVGNAQDNGVGDDHAYTVEYDVEALWVPDDRDSVWSDLASHAKAFYPGGAATNDGPLSGQEPVPIPPPPFTVRPGVDDQFPKGFFHDYNADYWFVTGVPVPAHKGNIDGDGTIDPGGPAPIGGALPGGVIPAILNSGVSGLQIAVTALVNQVVLIRCLNAAYNTIEVTFPVDVVLIAFDGRALGVPPFGRYNHAFELKAGVPYRLSTARRFDALIRSSTPVHDAAVVKFYETRGLNVRPLAESLLVTARIPIDIN